MSDAARERFLLDVHRRRPGWTRGAFERGGSYALVAREVAPGRVLELGCGDGALVERLLARGAEVVALDLSPDELARVRGAARVRARAQALPFADACFDAVASHLLWMLVADAAALVAEAARVLRPGGRFVALIGGGPTIDDDAYARAAARAAPTPLAADRRLRSSAGIAGLLDGAFEAIEQRDHHVEVTGPMLDYALESVEVREPCRAHVRVVTATRRGC